MGYLESTDYQAFGLPPDTNDSWIAVASSVINQYCRRETLEVNQYTERLRVTAGSHSVRLTYLPLCAVAPSVSPLITVQGRYGWPRRGEMPEPMAELVSSVFSLPGNWVTVDPSLVDWDANGNLTLPVGLLAPRFNEVQVTYTAGLAVIPDAVKSACAFVVKNAQATPGMNVKSSRADMMQVQYFSDLLVDSTVKMLLRPWVSTRLG